MAASTFCLCPAGDTCVTSRLYTAIAAGCLPVVLCDQLSHANAHEVWHCANLIGAPHLARAASKFAPSAAAAC